MKNQKLIESIRSLRQSIDESNSVKWAFILGIVRGVGAVIGATVLAGLLLSWAAATFDHVSDIPLVGPYFSDISETLESSE